MRPSLMSPGAVDWTMKTSSSRTGLAYCDAGLLVRVVQAHGLCDFYAQPASRIAVRISAPPTLPATPLSTAVGLY